MRDEAEVCDEGRTCGHDALIDGDDNCPDCGAPVIYRTTALDVDRLSTALRSIHFYSHDGWHSDNGGVCQDPIGSSNEDAASIAAAYAAVPPAIVRPVVTTWDDVCAACGNWASNGIHSGGSDIGESGHEFVPSGKPA